MEQSAKLSVAIDRGGLHQGYFGRSSRWKVSRLIPPSAWCGGGANACGVFYCFLFSSQGEVDQRAAAAQPFGVSVRTRTATAATATALPRGQFLSALRQSSIQRADLISRRFSEQVKYIDRRKISARKSRRRIQHHHGRFFFLRVRCAPTGRDSQTRSAKATH